MSNPARAPTEFTSAQMELAKAPAFYFTVERWTGIREKGKRLETIEEAKQLLLPLDLDPAPTVIIPPSLTIDQNVRQARNLYVGRTDKSPLVARRRTAIGQGAMAAAYHALPEDGQFSKAAVSQVVRGKVSLDGGAQYTLGRLSKAVPKRNAPAPPEPVTRAEAEIALDNCGIRMEGRMSAALRPYPLNAKAGDPHAIKVNPKSSNGFPVLGKWNTPGAAELAMGLAETVHRQVRAAHSANGRQGVVDWLREKELSDPYLVTLMGKTKADCYTEGKAEALSLRFYNVFPRQVLLNMQRSTQVLEGNATHLLNSDSNSAIGITLAHGGAEELVAELERRYEAQGYAYTHVGDDSWAIVRLADGTCVMFALDCSSFDLTQHGDVTKEVHEAMYRQLRLIDDPSASLWYAYARRRNVVTTGSINLTWRHCGPSGMPLQSKVNDMLMEVLLMRTIERMETVDGEDTLADVLAEVGQGMGFNIRLEQYVEGRDVRGILRTHPFLYIGYYFWANETGAVRCFADVARTLAQVPYPGVRWMEKAAVTPLEAMRVASIGLNLGIPPPELEDAFGAYRQFAIKTLDRAASEHVKLDEEALRWALKETPWGPTLIPSLAGLRAVLNDDPGDIWLRRETELPSSSVFTTSWADQAEEEEREQAQEEHSRLERPAELTVGAVLVPHRPRPTHPATWANAGRPPPTAVWGPDRPRRDRDQTSGLTLTGSTRMRRFGYIALETAYSEDDASGYEDDHDYYQSWSE